MAFIHRLTTPPATYYLQGGGGPFLAGYDYINDPPSNGDPGAISPADPGKKAAGINQGTYFVAFGEDATAFDANRANRALSESLDFIDNLLNELFPRVNSSFSVTFGAPATSVVITGDVFVGQFGTANNQANRNNLVSILDSSYNQVEISGTKAVASLIHNGAAVNVVGVTASGFFTGPTVNFNVTLPAGTYIFVHGTVSSVADLVRNFKGGLVENQIRAAQETSAEVRRLLRELHAPTGELWNDPWDSTIRALAASGLNERYRRKTGVPGSFTFDTPGDGAVITRDGRAPEVLSTSVTGFLDPINAHWITRHGGARGNLFAPAGDATGGTGYVSYSSRRHVLGAGSNEEGGLLGASSFLTVWPHDFTGAGVAGALTNVIPGVAGFANPGGIGADILELPIGQHFHNGARSAVALGYDLIEITVAGQIRTYVIIALFSAFPRRAQIKELSQNSPVFGVNTAISSFRWVTTLFQQGGGLSRFFDQISGLPDPVLWDSFFHAVPPYLTNTPFGSEAKAKPARFFAQAISAHFGTLPDALVWGGFDPLIGTGESNLYKELGALRGNGGVSATEYLTTTTYPAAAAGITTNFFLAGRWFIQAPAGNVTITFVSVEDGGTYEIFFKQDGVGGRTITWPAAAIFSGADAVPSPGASVVTKYTGHAAVDGTLKIFFTKTVY